MDLSALSVDLENYNNELYDVIRQIMHDSRIDLAIRDEYRNKLIKANFKNKKI